MKSCVHVMVVSFVGLACCAQLMAQELPDFPGADEEHQWLQQFVGQWESESEATLEPGKPPVKCQGAMSARMLGKLWVICESSAEMMGTKVTALQTIGYDPAKGKYVGSWVDSMMNHMWKYEGTVDDSGKKLTLNTEGPNVMGDGKMAKYRDAYEFKSKDHFVATSEMLSDDGTWVRFMTGHFRRKN